MNLLLKKDKFSDFLYYFLIFFSVVLSISFGEILDCNIGSIYDYIGFRIEVPLYGYILIAIFETVSFSFLTYFGLKNDYIIMNVKKRRNLIKYGFFATILFIIMTFNIVFKDNSYLNNAGNTALPTSSERAESILSFYQAILIFFMMTFLMSGTEKTSKFIDRVIYLFSLYAVITIIYSIITEKDMYYNFVISRNTIVFKDGDYLIKSVYNNRNNFGHSLIMAIVGRFMLGFKKNRYYFLGSLIFVPFVIFSLSRIGIISLFFLYIFLFGYLTYEDLKKQKRSGFIYLGLIVLMILSCLGFFIYSYFSMVSFGGKEIRLSTAILYAFKDALYYRFANIGEVFHNATFIDYLIGFGYEIHYIVVRTYYNLYYLHNAYMEYMAAGGIILCSYILAIYFSSLSKVYKIVRIDSRPLFFFAIISFTFMLYSLSESPTMLFNNYWGTILAFYFVCFPSFIYEYVTGAKKLENTSYKCKI